MLWSFLFSFYDFQFGVKKHKQQHCRPNQTNIAFNLFTGLPKMTANKVRYVLLSGILAHKP